jgi:hypothetical protein
VSGQHNQLYRVSTEEEQSGDYFTGEDGDRDGRKDYQGKSGYVLISSVLSRLLTSLTSFNCSIVRRRICRMEDTKILRGRIATFTADLRGRPRARRCRCRPRMEDYQEPSQLAESDRRLKLGRNGPAGTHE